MQAKAYSFFKISALLISQISIVLYSSWKHRTLTTVARQSAGLSPKSQSHQVNPPE